MKNRLLFEMGLDDDYKFALWEPTCIGITDFIQRHGDEKLYTFALDKNGDIKIIHGKTLPNHASQKWSSIDELVILTDPEPPADWYHHSFEIRGSVFISYFRDCQHVLDRKEERENSNLKPKIDFFVDEIVRNAKARNIKFETLMSELETRKW